MSHGRRTDYIHTRSGGRFYPLEPRADEVRLYDIAGSLSKTCRFTGQINRFYSVAQHSVLVSRLAAEARQSPAPSPSVISLVKVTPKSTVLDAVRWGLLHDASEAYLVDVPRPLKRDPKMGFYLEAEAKVMKEVALALDLPAEMPEVVKQVDNDALALELFHFFPRAHEPDGRGHVEALFSRLDHSEYLRDVFEPEMSPERAEALFIDECIRLGFRTVLAREASERRADRRARSL